jgi:hypothetical protein
MREIPSILAAYLAFICAHGAAQGHVPAPGNWRQSAWAKAALRLLAPGAFLLSIALWPSEGGFWISLLGASLSSCVSASIAILLSPLAPRVVWGLALASPILIALSAMGSSVDR